MKPGRIKITSMLALLGWMMAAVHCTCAGMIQSPLQPAPVAHCCCGHGADRGLPHSNSPSPDPSCPHCQAATVLTKSGAGTASAIIADVGNGSPIDAAVAYPINLASAAIAISPVFSSDPIPPHRSTLLRLHCALII